jgi:hypothetical protein
LLFFLAQPAGYIYATLDYQIAFSIEGISYNLFIIKTFVLVKSHDLGQEHCL